MLKTIPQYISAMSDTYGLTKTIGVIDICTTPSGEPIFYIGNNSIIFRIRHDGKYKMLKCYTREKQNLRRIYGERCLREELYIHSDDLRGEWVDVILDDWVEGITLHQAIIESLNNKQQLHKLAREFDRLAQQLLAEDWAHGDLKPENIIVTPEGELRLIDFDALFRPEFAGERSEEIGTAAFQHPARNIDYFDKSIDDYPITLISTALHALATNPALAERHDMEEALLLNPRDILNNRSKAYDEILELFAREGMAVQYRIALLLRSATPRLSDLERFINIAVAEHNPPFNESEGLILDNHHGLWGYRLNEEFVIPPLYDCGFEFSEGLAAVRVGGYWHYIGTHGSIILRCPQYESVKSFHNGRAVVVENGERKQIDHNGYIVEVGKFERY